MDSVIYAKIISIKGRFYCVEWRFIVVNKDGVDIYIDNDKQIMYVSMNEKMTYEAQSKIKESFSESLDYQIVVFEYINDIKFLN